MHGSGLNKSNAPRISLDLRFMKKNLKINKNLTQQIKDIFNFINKMREFLKLLIYYQDLGLIHNKNYSVKSTFYNYINFFLILKILINFK